VLLTPGGQWLAKLLGLANALAFYQLTSATSDWVMWIWLADDGIFSGGTSIVVLPITTHYMLGLLPVRAIRAASTEPARTRPHGERGGHHDAETGALDCGRGSTPATSHRCDGRSFWRAGQVCVLDARHSRRRYGRHLACPSSGNPPATQRA
jgi:hypothetical protein